MEDIKDKIEYFLNMPIVGSGDKLKIILFEIIDKIEALEKKINPWPFPIYVIQWSNEMEKLWRDIKWEPK